MTKILNIVEKNSLGGGIGTIINYLTEGMNNEDNFSADTLLTGYQRRKIDYDSKTGPKYQFRPKDSILKKFDKEGKEVHSEKYKHENLEEKLEEYDIIHVHGIPHYGTLEHLENLYKKKGKNKMPKIVNTAHSNVKQEFLAHYKNLKERQKSKKLNEREKGEEKSIDYFLDNNILNDPSKFSENYWGSAIWRQEKIMSLADAVQHMNDVYKNEIIKEFSAQENSEKHKIIPNGVKEIEYSIPREKKKRMLFVGRFAKEKGIDELIDSVPYILEKHPDAEIKFVGGDKEGKIVEKYKRKIQKNIKNHFKNKKEIDEKLKNINFTGWISDPKELEKQYQWTDYVLIPSHAESFSLTASEALMHKRIPVMTATPALKDLYIDKGIGIGIDPKERNAKGIAKTLINVLNNDESPLHDEIIERGEKFVKENYSFKKMIENQKNLYEDILKTVPSD